MDIDQVTQELSRRLAAPLPEYTPRRLIFWYDEDREFEDALDGLTLPGARLLRLDGRNTFYVKRMLAEAADTSFVIYDPLSHEDPDTDWLMDARLYGESFRADLLSSWMEEMGLPASDRLRRAVRAHRAFFQAKERRAKFARVRAEIRSERDLALAMMASLAGLPDAAEAGLVRAVLSRGLAEAQNPCYAAFLTYGLDGDFWEIGARCFGYGTEAPRSLSALAAHIFVTALSYEVRPELLEGLSTYMAVPYGPYCHDFMDQWVQSDEKKALYQIARAVEQETHLPEVLRRLAPSDIGGAAYIPCVHEILLRMWLADAAGRTLDRAAFRRIWERRRLFQWYEDYAPYYEALGGICRMEDFYAAHAEGFHEAEASAVWQRYVTEYYQMDQAYRAYRLAYQQGVALMNEVLDDLLKKAGEAAERLYTNWYLQELSACWDSASADDLARAGYVSGAERQCDFYKNHVAPADSRVFVIISDAMRYEVGAELAEKLRRETQCEAELSAMESVFPSATKFGMAALLPHETLSAELRGGALTVLADGMPTDSAGRAKVLRKACPASTAFQASEYMDKKRADRIAMVKGMDVIYIYHDRIDAASHTSDADVFQACSQTLEEITSLVRMLVNDSGAAHIFITADHGFLYQAQDISEADKAGPAYGAEAAELARRYVVAEKGRAIPGLYPVAFLGGETSFAAYAPPGTVRLKMRGGGLQFVHGGASLQELAVPLIDYRYMRNASSAVQKNREKYAIHPVPLVLLSAARRISSRTVSLAFYQTEAVGENRAAAVYCVYLTDSRGAVVSDIQKILADKKDRNDQARVWRCRISLKPGSYSAEEPYYLVIENEKTHVRRQEEFQILLGGAWME